MGLTLHDGQGDDQGRHDRRVRRPAARGRGAIRSGAATARAAPGADESADVTVPGGDASGSAPRRSRRSCAAAAASASGRSMELDYIDRLLKQF